MRSPGHSVAWINSSTERPKCFLGSSKEFSDKTSIMCESTDLIAYPVHVVLKNGSNKYCLKLLKNEQAVAGFLPVR